MLVDKSYVYQSASLVDIESIGTLHKQIERARLWLPLGIVAVVLLHQLVVVPLGNDSWQFWTQLLFYSILGPIITFLTLAWIAFQVREREIAQKELKCLYEELQASHDLLQTIQTVTEQFASVEASHDRTRHLLTLVETNYLRDKGAVGNLEHLLSTLLNQMMLRVEATMGGVYLTDEENFLQLKAHKGFQYPPSLAFLHVDKEFTNGSLGNEANEGNEGLITEVAKCAKSRIVNELIKEQRGIFVNAQSGIFIPLLIEKRLLGVVVLAHKQASHFCKVNLSFLDLLARQVSLAVHNARAYLQAEELAIAEERARIAREIHDGVAQMLAFSALKLDLVTKLIKQENLTRSQEELTLSKNTIRETIKEVRRSILALRPINLENHSFMEALNHYVYDFEKQNDVQVKLNLQPLPQLTMKSEVVLFRIFQESMHNVAKHAKASKVVISAGTAQNNHAFIEISDDGQGFNVKSVTDRVTSAGGLGLKQMRERIEARGGYFEICSSPKNGTKVFASLIE